MVEISSGRPPTCASAGVTVATYPSDPTPATQLTICDGMWAAASTWSSVGPISVCVWGTGPPARKWTWRVWVGWAASWAALSTVVKSPPSILRSPACAGGVGEGFSTAIVSCWTPYAVRASLMSPGTTSFGASRGVCPSCSRTRYAGWLPKFASSSPTANVTGRPANGTTVTVIRRRPLLTPAGRTGWALWTSCSTETPWSAWAGAPLRGGTPKLTWGRAWSWASE